MSVKVLFIKYVTVSTCDIFARAQLAKSTQRGKGNVVTEMFLRWNVLFLGGESLCRAENLNYYNYEWVVTVV